MGPDSEVVLYEVDGPVATITMNRPEVANAQNTAVIDGIDHFLDVADADDEVRVVVLAGAGKHFSAGHDLKALVIGSDTDPWVAMRETPEGKFRHEQTMYYERCKRLYSFRKPTIARVQGATVAAGLMLACMCDLIVAADNATFSRFQTATRRTFRHPSAAPVPAHRSASPRGRAGRAHPGTG